MVLAAWNRRWVKVAARTVLLSTGLAACTQQGRSFEAKKVDATPVIGDHTEQHDSEAPRIVEAGMRARYADGRVLLDVPLEAASITNHHEGARLTARLVDGQTEEVRAEGSAMVSREGGVVSLALTGTQPLLGANGNLGELARMILVVESAQGTAVNRVRRDLFRMLDFLEVTLVAPQAGSAAGTLRVQVDARDRSGAAQAGTPVSARVRGAAAAADAVPQRVTGTTDASGHAELDVTLPSDGSATAELEVLLGEGGAAGRWAGSVTLEQGRQVLLTTDKPRYQPGQMMHLRGLALNPTDRTPHVGPVLFEVQDARGNLIFRQAATTNAHGVAAASFKVGKRINEGQWKVRMGLGEDGRTSVVARNLMVEQYVLPRFKVDVVAPPAQVRPGESVSLTVKAGYTFGVALNGGTAHLQASLKGQVVADSVATLSGSGEATFQFSAPGTGDGRAAPLEVNVEVTDSAGGKSTGSSSVLVVPEGLALQGWFADPVSVGGRNTLYVLVTDSVGTPQRGTVTINGSNGMGMTREADASGLIEVPLTGLAEGAYVSLQAQQNNDLGAYGYVQAPRAGEGLRVRAATPVVEAGAGVDVSVQSSLAAAGSAVVDVYARGSRVASVPVTLGADGAGVAQLRDIPGGLVRLVARSMDGQRVGQGVVYAREDRALRVDVTPGAATYAPRDEAAVRVAVKDAQGAGVAAAVGVTVVDEAVFALADVSGPVKAFGGGDTVDAPSGFDTSALLGAQATNTAQQAALLSFGRNLGALHQVDLGAATRARAVNEAQGMVQRDANDIGTAASNAGIQPWSNNGDNLRDWLRVQAFLDPWGNAYALPDEGSSYYARLLSNGPDEVAGNADDLSAYVYVGGAQAGGGGVADGDFQGAPAPEAGGSANGNTGGEPSRGDNGAPAITVRREFPETLLVNPMVITDGTGVADLSIPLADSITTWRVGAVASDLQGRVGVGQGGVRVFQDFFVDLDIPTTLTEGDEVAITAVINNFKSEGQAVALQLEAGDWATVLSGGNQVVNVGPVSVQGTTVRLKANRVGEFGLTLRAVGSGLSDALVRRVRVKPSGDEKPFTKSDRLDTAAQVTVDIPANATPGATELTVRVQPGVTSEVVNGLDSMVRMPGGCFEQTSSSNYPNVLIAQYLARTGQSQPELQAKIQQYMQEGYQRLTSYEVSGGGFSWFGDAPAHNVLTAYGLMQFVDMREVFPVDAALIARTATWLAGQQKADGSFEPTAGGIAEGAINAYERNTFRTTAFLTWALARAGGHTDTVERAVTWLRSNLQGVTDGYSLAVYANALSTVQSAHPDLPNAVGALLAQSRTGDEGTVSFPGSEPSALAPCGGSPTEQTDLEVTALAAQALIRGEASTESANGALRHLVRNKDSFGTWQSTQATIRSIQAFLVSLGGSNESASGTLRVLHNGQEVGTFTVTPADANVQRVVDLSELATPGSTHVIEVERTGTGNFQYQVSGRSFVPRAAPQAPAITVNTTYANLQPSVGESVTVRTLVRTLSGFEQLMVEAPIPPGFDADLSALAALRTAGTISRAEVVGDWIHIYAPKLTPDAPITLEWSVRPRLSASITAMPVKAYAYYDPSLKGEGSPVSLLVP